MLRTICTGCTLSDPQSNRKVHGDLWLDGGSYIFNACLRDGETAWEYGEEGMKGSTRVLTIHSERQYFERRGVIVLPTVRCTMNQVLLDHVSKDLYATPTQS